MHYHFYGSSGCIVLPKSMIPCKNFQVQFGCNDNDYWILSPLLMKLLTFLSGSRCFGLLTNEENSNCQFLNMSRRWEIQQLSSNVVWNYNSIKTPLVDLNGGYKSFQKIDTKHILNCIRFDRIDFIIYLIVWCWKVLWSKMLQLNSQR